ncbi:hypothetical protein ACH5RR_006726 [Cinchona calisaya]|uniref:Uncharacterized protein n=1 Tax=Cinchona calisaya TaxID=153742 RepID=A0ABD3APU8_9GENT
MTKDLGFTCKTYNACLSNCMLFMGEYEEKDKCETCETCRYKKGCKRIVIKQILLKPRLQKLFMSLKTTSRMKWHIEESRDDGSFRHPTDSQAWKNFDKKNPSFAGDVRNVRLGLDADGFNPIVE